MSIGIRLHPLCYSLLAWTNLFIQDNYIAWYIQEKKQFECCKTTFAYILARYEYLSPDPRILFMLASL